MVTTSPRVETPTIEFTPSGPISISREQQARDVFRSRSTGGGGGGSSPAPTPMVESTPSLGAVLKSEFGIKQPKLSTGLERTGLVERALITPKIIKPLGPFKI